MFVAGVLGYLFQLLVTRKLTVAEYGELQSLIGLLGLLSISAVMLGNFIGRYTAVIGVAHDAAATRGFLSWLNRRCVIIVPIGFTAYLALMPLVARYLHLPSVVGLACIGVVAVFTIFSIGYTNILTGWGNFTSTNTSLVVGACLKLAAGIVIVMLSATANAAALAIIIGAVGSWFVLRMSARRTIGSGPTTDWRTVYFAGLDLRKTVLPIFFFSFTSGLVGSVGILLVKNLTSATTAGYYGVLTLFGSVFVMVSSAIAQVTRRAVCAAEYREAGSGRRPLGMAYLLIIAMSVIGIVAYATLPQLIINAVVGAKYVAVAPDLWLFGVSASVMSLLFLEVTLAYARNDLWISAMLAMTVVLIGLTTYVFHATIRAIVLDSILSLSVGYVGAFIFNQVRRKQCLQPPAPVEVATPVI